MDRTNSSPTEHTSPRIPELLAPAGNLSTAITAFESGADAVYCGLPRFNAREMGENFRFEDLSKLAGYAHRNSKAFYVTFNTLLKEQELEAAVKDLQRITSLDPHGVIVQDFGAVRILRELFPGVPIHGSTQMGIHNSAGVATAARMGIERVILERQITLDELKELVPRSPVEVEVFVHGALCCSLSGRCLFSSWIGGWSGNRGKCKQPCRRRYYTQDEGRKRAGFFFSTQDLYTLDMLEIFAELGVASLKIEGRLKKPDYVQSVVGAYRMVLDSIAAGEPPDIKSAKAVLAESYGRRWSHGFATQEDMESLIVPDNIGVSGMRIGKVTGTTARGVLVEVRKRLRIGDRIRIQPASGGEGPAFTVRRLLQGGKNTKTVSEGKAEVQVDKEVPEEGFVYRIGISRKTPGPKPEELSPYVPPRRVALEITIDREGLRVTAFEEGREKSFSWSSEVPVEPARAHALDEESVREMFSATRNAEIAAGRIDVRVGEGLFVPLSRLKQARRDFWSWLIEQLPSGEHAKSAGRTARELLESLRVRGDVRESSPATVCALRRGEKLSRGCGWATESLSARVPQGREAELPHFIRETELQETKDTVDTLLEQMESGERRTFRITDLAHLELLEGRDGLRRVTGYPLPVTNSLAAEELRRLGVEQVQAWVELDREGLSALLDTAPVSMEVYTYGRPFLLVTRAEIPAEGRIVDGRGKEFEIMKDAVSGLNYLFPPEIFRIDPPAGAAEFKDLRNISPGKQDESSFNFEVEFV